MLREANLPLGEIQRRLLRKQGCAMLSHTGDTVKFDGLLGVTADGVPVMSNGSELHYSNTPSIIPAAQPLSSFERARCDVESLPQLGVKWQCVEFVRRYLAATKAVWLASVPTAEDLWTHDGDLFSYISTNQPVPYLRIVNGEDRISPQVGDIVVWSQCERMPFGHVAVVTESPDNKHVRVAEQNHGFSAWPVDAPFSRELEVRFHSDDSAELWDAEGVAVLGWLRVDAPPYDFTRGNICDDYRMVLGNGSIERHHVQSEVTVPWLNPSSSSLDLVLKRSLCHDGCTDNGAEASVEDVPSGIYFLDYDMWCSIGRAAKSLHAIAMQATENVLSDPDSEYLLEHYFGVVPHLQPLLRQSWETTQALGGRFDFGFNGKSVGMFEYNCDSSGALLECCDTQEKIAKHYGVQAGLSAGSFLSAKCVTYFKRLLSNSVMCPSHALIHFLIDNDDEERYTAMCMMGFAETAGFRTKLLQSPTALHFGDANTPEDGERPQYEDREIFDEDNERVMLVWKTWSWDTVLHQYERQWIKDSPNPRSIGAPTLSDVLLNDTVKVLEPLWKAVTGSKAVLPFMYSMARDHPHMLPASFFRTREIISGNYISKPVNGRAGQNITMHDPVVDKTELDNAPRVEGDHPLHLAEPRTLSPSRANSSRGDSFFPSSFAVSCDDNGNECSPGRFFDSVEVFQKRLFLKKFDSKYFPIFCAWMVGDEFGGVVVREDTSKITKLGSVVVPARVLRNTRLLDGNAK